ncbi:nitrilase [Moraxella cuniculi DSM 21768]|uniref:Nitrilase n=1 Tax=Moraxella cuniculi DSM 21768 TaxID=1122245 RepID=A0A1N7DDB4_9GAMM|nr:carbon-nitrogen hydrolase family protein [Moraxella cuniculi]OOS07993.1 carbon-nitrogen hydrolase [Moraxella cuniculi]SIR73849.1 nitrilase [Moraxella cuniculi DSM 21768]
MSFAIASIGLNSQTSIDNNLRIISHAVNEAAQAGAKLIVLPENACAMGRQDELAIRFDEICQFYQTLAQKQQIHLVAGTLPCPNRPDGSKVGGGRFRQTSLMIDPAGNIKARYDKIHLFRAMVNDSTGRYDESQTFEAGDEVVIANCMIDGVAVNVGMMICFDVRFPALAQQLRQQGADILTVPAAFTQRTGQAHWQLLLQARALDSQCMVIGSAQGGMHHIGSRVRETWGHSLIADANGQVVATTGEMTGEYQIVYANYTPSEQRQIRQNLPIFDCHRLS